ncbi:MAG: transglutaminase-like family protein [Blastochloris sp.]|nr:transglutaminase-like family protein [Blastochloris sp.]
MKSESSIPVLPAATWKQVQACARAVEKRINQTGLILTMGGEPTFVPFQPEGEEWSTTALGPTKLLYARRFAAEWVQRYHPGSLITQSYGKQYPGEALPRWNLVIHHHPQRNLWSRPERLLLGPPLPPRQLANPKKVMQALARTLGLSTHIHQAAELSHPKTIIGYVLPLAWEKKGWTSAHWSFPSQPRHLIPLIPGDSSIGLRIPLNELPPDQLKRALTIEIKDGGLEVFFPPLDPEPYLRLVRLVEKWADTLDLHGLILSGYQPRQDHNLQRTILASDPGVIEVNLPPSQQWSTYHQQLEELYTAAHAVGLCARKLHFNGRVHGTGGGAHICFGGPEPRLSPVFQIPELLPAVLSYWQNHPALSYVFSGQFVGPASQAPRVDETMPGTLEELALAFRGIRHFPDNPELYAMLFRDLLSDSSGNTHRAEISIDKLWNTQHANTMLGILEFRAFEAYPEVRQQSLTGLLLRAILAMLMHRPKLRPILPWGSALHDHYFLPSHLWQDLDAICRELSRYGFPFQSAWFRPLFDCRFPEIGILPLGSAGSIHFRHALEAWPLLSEQPVLGGTARFVDSSTERIEVRLSNTRLAGEGWLLINKVPCLFSS